VLDVDRDDADAAALELLGTDELPATPAVRTGSGRLQLYFADPGGLAKRVRDGFELRVGEHQCVAPPSEHPDSGRPYQWLPGRAPWEVPPAELPAALVDYFAAGGRRNGATAVEGVIPQGRRRAELLSLAGTLRRRGLAGDEILAALAAVNERRCDPPLEPGELAGLAHDVAGRYEPDAEHAIATVPAGSPQPLEAVVDTFSRWLHQPDPGALYAVLAAVAANLLDGDPLWMLLVGPSGGGKTELLAAAGGLPDVHAAATLTEAALLSGVARKDVAQGASGGLLREVGDFGILVLKDFGSVLSQHRDTRAAVMAALRELFDGAWTRRLGTDGGKTLHWEGKLGLLAGCTPAIDQHHAVLAALGERFLWYRLAVDDPAEQARRSLEHAGRERQMRRELSDAVRGLFAGIDLSRARHPDAVDRERLIALATLVVRCRSAVLRDSYSSREIELVPDSEAPGRLVGVLGRLLTALRLIGVPEPDAWRVTVRAGLDSMPALRWRALSHLLAAAAPEKTSDVAAACDLPTNTTRRVLEDLAAHGVVTRYPGGEGKADTWTAAEWARDRHRRATVPEKSVQMRSPSIKTPSDVSGTPPEAST
jgi:hypothetical protein